MKPGLKLLAFLVVPILGFYVFARSQTDQDPGKAQREAPSVVVSGAVIGRGYGYAAKAADVALCRADGANLDASLSGDGMLRIEYKNGSMSQIDLLDVKKMAVVAKPDR